MARNFLYDSRFPAPRVEPPGKFRSPGACDRLFPRSPMIFRTLLALFALAVGFAGPATAQVSTTGTIVVTVQDPDGGRLPGVVVTAKAADSVTTRSAVTNEEGVATLEALAPSALY